MNRKTDDEIMDQLEAGIAFMMQLKQGGRIDLAERWFPEEIEQARVEERTWTEINERLDTIKSEETSLDPNEEWLYYPF